MEVYRLEEKKAIEWLKGLVKIIKRDNLDNTYAGILLNLIEKQSKEIEELKKENLEIRDWKYVIDSPIDLDKLKELDLIKIKGKEYVSKDKIKAKIEEVDEMKSNGEYTILFNSDNVMEVVKAVLQSLLEKE